MNPESGQETPARVVPMRLAHLAEVLELGFRVFDVNAMPYTSWSLTSVAEHFDSQPDACWVAEHEGVVVGFVLGSMSFDEREDWAYLEWIGLDPAYEGHGLAAQLLEECCQALFHAGAARIITDVEHGNESSARLMRRAGFDAGVTVTLFVRTRTSEHERGRLRQQRPGSRPSDPARARLHAAARRAGNT